jgi:hypothetical protein
MSKLEDKLAASIRTGPKKAPAAARQATRKSVPGKRADPVPAPPAVKETGPATDAAPDTSPFRHPRRVWPD